MNVEEIAKRLSQENYLKLCEACEKEASPAFSLEQYWQRNKEYFIDRAKTYLAVKECIEEQGA